MSRGKINTPPWVRLPMEVLKREDMTKSDILLLAVLIDQLIMLPDKSAAINQNQLAEVTGLCIRSIQYAERHLVELGLITKTRTGRETIYTLAGAAATEEILPKKRAAQTYSSRKKTAKPMTTKEIEEMNAYLSLVNRFKDDDEGGTPQ